MLKIHHIAYLGALAFMAVAFMPLQAQAQTVGTAALTIQVPAATGGGMTGDASPTRAQVLGASFVDTGTQATDGTGTYHIFRQGNLYFAWRPPATGTEGTLHEITAGGSRTAAGGTAPDPQGFGTGIPPATSGISGVTDDDLPTGYTWVGTLIEGGDGSNNNDYRILMRTQSTGVTYYRVFAATGITGSGNTVNQARPVEDAMVLNGVSIGNAAAPTRSNQFILGNSRHQYTLPGLGSANNSAQSGTTWVVTTDENGNLGRGAVATGAVEEGPNDDEYEAGVAAAIALAGIKHPYGSDFSLGGSVGFFEGGVAIAWQLSWMPMENLIVSGGGTHGVTEEGNGGHISASFGF